EEAEELHAAGCAFEVVHGISSTIAGPGYAGIPVTHRDFCSQLTIFTGHEDPDKEESSLDFAQLAKTPGTLITIAGLVAERGFKAPAVCVIGGVVTLRDRLNWFERRPLFGKRIVVTR